MSAWAIVREARTRAGLTQRELARRARKAQSEIARIETGRQEPTFPTLERLVRAAGFDLKVQLVPHDEHDERLIRSMLSLTPDERLRTLEEPSALFASARLVDDGETTWPAKPPALGARALLETLARHSVDYLLIGGVAERLWGSPRLTDDLDICPATGRTNLRRLAAALNELGAAFRPAGPEEGMTPPEPWSESSLGSFTSLALTTRFGRLDVWFRPDGTSGYDDLVRNAAGAELAGLRVRIASLDDIIRSKEAAGGTRYLAQLPLLRELREQRRRMADGR